MIENPKVGDRVTVVGQYLDQSALAGITTITEVAKKYFVLADGSKWTLDGTRSYSLAKTKWYVGPNVRRTEAGDSTAIRRQRIISQLNHQKVEWNDVSDEDVLAIGAILAKYKKPKA